MNNNDLARMASEYMSVWNAGNEYLLDQTASKDLEIEYSHFDEPYHGIAECRSMLRMTHGYFPDLKLILKKILPNTGNNTVTVFWEYTGTHRSGNLFGAAPSGKKVKVSGLTLLETENDRIRKEIGIIDNLSLLMQLGIISSKKTI